MQVYTFREASEKWHFILFSIAGRKNRHTVCIHQNLFENEEIICKYMYIYVHV
jgi:hypothetical protein